MAREPGQDLGSDQPFAVLDPAMIESARAALEAGQTHYVDVPGIGPLREALADFLTGMGAKGYAPTDVLVTAGMQEARFLAIQMIGARFGRIALPEVVDPGAREAATVRRLEVEMLAVDRERGLLPGVEAIGGALAGGCRLLYLESPSRLTGAVYDRASLDAIARLAREHQAGVIWDQGLAPWADGYISLAGLRGMASRVAVMGEAWPGTGLESLMVGYLAAPGDWLEPIRSQKQIMAICTSTPSQYAAVKAPPVYAAVHGPQRDLLAAYRARAAETAMAAGAEVLPGNTANILAVREGDGVAGDPRQRAAIDRVKAAGFGYADGADFGAPGVLRLAVTLDNGIARALAAIA